MGCSFNGVPQTINFPTSFSSIPQVAISWVQFYWDKDVGIINIDPLITSITNSNFVITLYCPVDP